MANEFNSLDHNTIIINAVHERIHEGQNFIGSDIGLAVADAADRDYLIKTGAIPPHLVFSVNATGEVTVTFFEGTTVSADGTGITLFDSNRVSANTPLTTLFHTPTVTVAGTQLLIRKLGASLPGPSSIVGVGEQRNEAILAASSNYLLRITNNEGAAIDIGSVISFYEPKL